jgi:tetratricopeptide (TPR) repeat protein
MGNLAVLRWRATVTTVIACVVAVALSVGCAQELRIAARPLPPRPWSDLVNDANTHIRVGAYESAVELLDRSLDLRPDEAPIHLKLGQLLSAMGDTEGARFHLDAALALGEDRQARNYLGFVEESAGAHAPAATQFEIVLADHPDDQYALVHAGLAYQQGGPVDDAIAALELADALDPTRADPASQDLDFYMGLAYQAGRRYPDAIEAYTRRSATFPADMRPYMRRGAIQEDLGELDAAKAEYEQAYALDATDEEARASIERVAGLIRAASDATVEVVPAVRILPDDIDERIAAAWSSTDHAGADAVILLSRSEHEITPTGRTRFSTRQVVQLRHRRSFGEYGEVAIPYNAASQNIGVNVARAILPDGTVIDVGADGIRDVTPPDALNFNLYSDSLWKVISFPALAEGVVLEYQVTVEDKVGRGNTNNMWFWGAMTFQASHPTLASQYALRTPNGVPFLWKAYQCELQADITPAPDAEGVVQGPTVTYRWEYGETPPYATETNGPPATDVLPRFAFSSVEEWDTLHDWYRSLLTGRTVLDEEVSTAVANVVQNARDHDDRLRSLADFVASETRYVGIQLGQGEYQPHPAAEVLRHRYGDCKDKCTLLMTMFQAIGVEAYPALINPTYGGSDIDLDLPSLGQFSHMILAVPDATMPGGYAWVDPTDDTVPYGRLPASDQGRTVMLVTDDAPVWVQTPIDTPEMNRYDWTLTLGLDPGGAVYGAENLVATGTHASDVRRAYRAVSPGDLAEYMRALMSPEYPGVDVDAAELAGVEGASEAFSVTADFTVGQYGSKTKDAWSIPILSAALSSYAALVAEPGRTRPMVLGVPNTLTRTVSVEIPAGYEAPDLPPPLLLQSEFASLSRTTVVEDAHVVYRLELVVRQHTVPPERYDAVRAVFEALAREEDAAVVLRRRAVEPSAAEPPPSLAVDEVVARWQAAWADVDRATLLRLYDEGAVVQRGTKNQAQDAMVGLAELAAHLAHIDALYARVAVGVTNLAVTSTGDASGTVVFDQSFRGYADEGATTPSYSDVGTKTLVVVDSLITEEGWEPDGASRAAGPFYLQIASFERQAPASTLADKLGAGASVEKASLSSGVRYRVIAGSYRSEEMAAAAARAIASEHGADPIVRQAGRGSE